MPETTSLRKGALPSTSDSSPSAQDICQQHPAAPLCTKARAATHICSAAILEIRTPNNSRYLGKEHVFCFCLRFGRKFTAWDTICAISSTRPLVSKSCFQFYPTSLCGVLVFRAALAAASTLAASARLRRRLHSSYTTHLTPPSSHHPSYTTHLTPLISHHSTDTTTSLTPPISHHPSTHTTYTTHLTPLI